MSSTAAPTVGELFQEAHDAGDLSGGSLQVLQNIGAHFQAALGTPAADVNASEVTLFNILVDNTGSLSPYTQEVIDGVNLCLDALTGSKQKDSIFISVRYYDSILNAFCALEDADHLDNHNYRASLGRTPLFDGALELLGVTAAKTQEFAGNGVPVRSVSVIVTDGADNASKHKAADVAQVVKDLLRAETHIIAGMGIDDGYTDFTAVFESMGVPANWILTPGNDASAIRQAFQVVSQSAVKVSQAANVSHVAMGGFGTGGYL